MLRLSATKWWHPKAAESGSQITGVLRDFGSFFKFVSTRHQEAKPEVSLMIGVHLNNQHHTD